MPTIPKQHSVYQSINKPLTIWGVERRLFFLALLMGAATFNFFGSLLGGILMFGALYLLARWTTKSDPQLLKILLNSSKFKHDTTPPSTKFLISGGFSNMIRPARVLKDDQDSGALNGVFVDGKYPGATANFQSPPTVASGGQRKG